MKNSILYIGLLLVTLVQAQEADTKTSDQLTFEKGTQFVNSNLTIAFLDREIISLDDGSVTDITNNGFIIRTSYAYSIARNLFLGLGLGYQYITYRRKVSNEMGDERNISNRYSIFPYARYYKGIGKKVALYLQAEASITHTNFESSTSNGFSAGLRPGFTYMMNKNLALEASLGFLGYTSGSFEDENVISESDSNSFRFALNSSNFLFGLNYYF